jgi:hypothetical protein
MYGHIQKLAEAEQAGLKKVGINADLFQYGFPAVIALFPRQL